MAYITRKEKQSSIGVTCLDIRPWSYRVYKGNSDDELLLEISACRVIDNPYEPYLIPCFKVAGEQSFSPPIPCLYVRRRG
jgi:hypothetical protein